MLADVSIRQLLLATGVVGVGIGLLSELHDAKLIGFGSLYAGAVVVVAAAGRDFERAGQIVGGFLVLAGVVLSVARDFSRTQRNLAMLGGVAVGAVLVGLVHERMQKSSPTEVAEVNASDSANEPPEVGAGARPPAVAERPEKD
jgi:hypothetical protein